LFNVMEGHEGQPWKIDLR